MLKSLAFGAAIISGASVCNLALAQPPDGAEVPQVAFPQRIEIEPSLQEFSLAEAQRNLERAGFGGQLKPCGSEAGARQAECEVLRRAMGYVVGRFTVSRREDARWFIDNYVNKRFEPLLFCLRTTCDGLFVLIDASGAQWANKWARLLEFQGCIHSAPAVTSELAGATEGYKASYRLSNAVSGEVEDCPPSRISSDGFALLSRFNLAGQF